MKVLLSLILIATCSLASPATLELSQLSCTNLVHTSMSFSVAFSETASGRGYVNIHNDNTVISIKNNDPAWECRIS